MVGERFDVEWVPPARFNPPHAQFSARAYASFATGGLRACDKCVCWGGFLIRSTCSHLASVTVCPQLAKRKTQPS